MPVAIFLNYFYIYYVIDNYYAFNKPYQVKYLKSKYGIFY